MKVKDQMESPKQSTSVTLTPGSRRARWTVWRIWSKQVYDQLEDHFRTDHRLLSQLGLTKVLLEKVDHWKNLLHKPVDPAYESIIFGQLTKLRLDKEDGTVYLRVKELKCAETAEDDSTRRIIEIHTDMARVITDVVEIDDYVAVWGGVVGLDKYDKIDRIVLNNDSKISSYIAVYRHDGAAGPIQNDHGQFKCNVKKGNVKNIYFESNGGEDVTLVQTILPQKHSLSAWKVIASSRTLQIKNKNAAPISDANAQNKTSRKSASPCSPNRTSLPTSESRRSNRLIKKGSPTGPKIASPTSKVKKNIPLRFLDSTSAESDTGSEMDFDSDDIECVDILTTDEEQGSGIRKKTSVVTQNLVTEPAADIEEETPTTAPSSEMIDNNPIPQQESTNTTISTHGDPSTVIGNIMDDLLNDVIQSEEYNKTNQNEAEFVEIGEELHAIPSDLMFDDEVILPPEVIMNEENQQPPSAVFLVPEPVKVVPDALSQNDIITDIWSQMIELHKEQIDPLPTTILSSTSDISASKTLEVPIDVETSDNSTTINEKTSQSTPETVRKRLIFQAKHERLGLKESGKENSEKDKRTIFPKGTYERLEKKKTMEDHSKEVGSNSIQTGKDSSPTTSQSNLQREAESEREDNGIGNSPNIGNIKIRKFSIRLKRLRGVTTGETVSVSVFLAGKVEEKGSTTSIESSKSPKQLKMQQKTGSNSVTDLNKSTKPTSVSVSPRSLRSKSTTVLVTSTRSRPKRGASIYSTPPKTNAKKSKI